MRILSKAWARMAWALARLRLLKRLRAAEEALASLAFCPDCPAVIFLGHPKLKITRDANGRIQARCTRCHGKLESTREKRKRIHLVGA